MKLHKIAELVGKNVSGIVFDLRTRKADGSLTYDFDKNPIIGHLEKVEVRMEKIGQRDTQKSPWLYWTWDGWGKPDGYNCGFSGIANHWDDYFLEEVSLDG